MTHDITIVSAPRVFIRAAAAAIMEMSACVQAQEAPSFDCAKARTQVEHVLCAGGNSGMGWIDQTMAGLYKAALLRPGADALKNSQRAWLVQRNGCAGSDVKIMNCLNDSYRARFREITAPYDPGHLTGTYASDPINGLLDSVLFPDNTLAVTISASLGAPSYNSCSLSFRGKLQGDTVQYKPSEDEDSTDKQCIFVLKATGQAMSVVPSGCDGYCANGSSAAGAYKRLR